MFTHIHDEKVEPAPVVGEIFLEAVCDPLEEHLQHKDVGEDLVGGLQHHLHHFPLLDVDIFKRLQQRREDGVRRCNYITPPHTHFQRYCDTTFFKMFFM